MVKWIRYLETSRKLEPKCVSPQLFSGIVTRDAPVSYWPILSVSPVTDPGVLANCNVAKFPLDKCGGVYVSVRSPWKKFSCVSSQM